MESLDKPLVNRVAASGLITLKPEEWWPEAPVMELDLAPFLFQGLLLREQEFRQKMKEMDWQPYQDAILCVYCSTDAIIPLWAHMLVASAAKPHVKECFLGNREAFLAYHYRQTIQAMDWSGLKDKKVVVKGCGEKEVPAAAYAALGFQLNGVVQSLMFGEACSTVPIYKNKKE